MYERALSGGGVTGAPQGMTDNMCRRISHTLDADSTLVRGRSVKECVWGGADGVVSEVICMGLAVRSAARVEGVRAEVARCDEGAGTYLAVSLRNPEGRRKARVHLTLQGAPPPTPSGGLRPQRWR